jgi:hypothetical protein
MTFDHAFLLQKTQPASHGGQTTGRRDRGQLQRVKRSQKRSNRVLRHLPKLFDFPLPEVALKFCEVAPIGINRIAGQAAFDADMIKITFDQGVRVQFAR